MLRSRGVLLQPSGMPSSRAAFISGGDPYMVGVTTRLQLDTYTTWQRGLEHIAFERPRDWTLLTGDLGFEQVCKITPEEDALRIMAEPISNELVTVSVSMYMDTVRDTRWIDEIFTFGGMVAHRIGEYVHGHGARHALDR